MLIPAPRADQPFPSHLAMFLAGLPSAVVNNPPANTSLPETASAKTSGLAPFIPAPNADQLFPSHLAMFVAAIPPALVNEPPTYTLLPDTASADAWGHLRGQAPPIPEPRDDQVLPSHLAMQEAGMPPAVLK